MFHQPTAALTAAPVEVVKHDIRVDNLSGNRTLNIPGYGSVAAHVLKQGASRFGPEEFWVKTWDAPAMAGCTLGRDTRHGFATREEAEARADEYLIGAYRILAAREAFAAKLEKVA